MGRTPPGQTRERVLKLVRERLLAGLPPTVREVQQALGFRAVQTAREHLEALVEEGRLTKQAGKSRSYRLPTGPGHPSPPPPTLMVPILGRVQAGALSLAVEHLEGYVPFHDHTRAADDLFALHVRGESMTGAGILPGDIVLVRRQPRAASGEIVVALVDDEATVKRLRLRNNRVELHPENPVFEIILPSPEDLRILGKVIEVRRHLGRP